MFRKLFSKKWDYDVTMGIESSHLHFQLVLVNLRMWRGLHHHEILARWLSNIRTHLSLLKALCNIGLLHSLCFSLYRRMEPGPLYILDECPGSAELYPCNLQDYLIFCCVIILWFISDARFCTAGHSQRSSRSLRFKSKFIVSVNRNMLFSKWSKEFMSYKYSFCFKVK